MLHTMGATGPMSRGVPSCISTSLASPMTSSSTFEASICSSSDSDDFVLSISDNRGEIFIELS